MTTTALKWTAEKPTKPGPYWWKPPLSHTPVIVYMWPGGDVSGVNAETGCSDLIEANGGQWAGPIEPPEE
jgi:hypothetical protein